MATAARCRGFPIVVFVLACAVVIWTSLIPPDQLPKTNISDKIEHAASYAGLALAGLWAFPRRYGRLAVGLMALGIVIEVLQGVMGLGRQADVMDALADGAGLGLVLIAPLIRAVKRR
jgi:VanZ family protein